MQVVQTDLSNTVLPLIRSGRIFRACFGAPFLPSSTVQQAKNYISKIPATGNWSMEVAEDWNTFKNISICFGSSSIIRLSVFSHSPTHEEYRQSRNHVYSREGENDHMFSCFLYFSFRQPSQLSQQAAALYSICFPPMTMHDCGDQVSALYIRRVLHMALRAPRVHSY